MATRGGTEPLSLNARAGALADALAVDAAALGVGVSRGPGGERLIDCGHRHPGGVEAGLGLARVCLGGLTEVALVPSAPASPLPWSVMVRTSRPLLACLGSQYAGWSLHGEGGATLLGSGPARALARREAVFDDLRHEEQSDLAVLAVEGEAPPPSVAAAVAEACGVARDRLTLLHAPTGSPAGMTQVAARALECAVQKARSLGFPLGDIREGMATAPLAPPSPDATDAMGRANDAIIYGGLVHLFVAGDSEAARHLARELPSRTSPSWGRTFAEVFEEADGDFGRIDAGFFSPARVLVTTVESGRTFAAGRFESARLVAPEELRPVRA